MELEDDGFELLRIRHAAPARARAAPAGAAIAATAGAALIAATAAAAFAALAGAALLGGAAPAAAASGSDRTDPLAAVQILREGGCGGLMPPVRPLEHDVLLDHVAQEWAAGRTLAQATEHIGYLTESSSGLRVTGAAASIMQTLRQSSCTTVMNASMREAGIYRRGSESWIVLASKYSVPSSAQAPALAARTLQLVNEARARTTRCGNRSFAPAPPVTLSGTLGGVALGHASDMAENDYFEHEDLAGHTPADRVRAVGYREKLVGENIAFGPRTADEVVQGWLDSPGHCENIMDPRFAEMGIAYAAGRGKRGLYWVQVLAAPRA
jgi:uncharacterized protein YkwD